MDVLTNDLPRRFPVHRRSRGRGRSILASKWLADDHIDAKFGGTGPGNPQDRW